MTEYTDEDREKETALVMLGAWGDQSEPDEPWNGYRWNVTGYCPDGMFERSWGVERHECVTVLDSSLSDPKVPAGFRLLTQYSAGEHECPWCGPGTGDDDDGKSPEARRPDCALCEGDGYLYWGDECQVCVFGPIDPDATLKAIRELLAVRDNTGIMWNDQQGRTLARLVEDLDAHMSAGNEGPRAWTEGT